MLHPRVRIDTTLDRRLRGAESKFCISRAGKRFRLPYGEFSIGRASTCEIEILHDSKVSRFHAKMTITPDRALIQDLASSNGTIVNGALLPAGHHVELQPHDIVVIGLTLFTFDVEPA